MFQLLVVDDDKNVRRFLSAVLSHAGYKTFLAVSAKEALPIMEKNKIDLIILDIMLPDMDTLSLNCSGAAAMTFPY